MTNKYLSSIGVAIKHQVHLSDGSPTLYKCRVNFVDASHGQDDFGFRVDKHYFGSRHGKGPCDGEVGVVKRCALNSVKTRKAIIGYARDLYDFCCQGLSLPKVDGDHVHQKRCFMYVSSGEVDRSRSGRTDGIKTVKNTRMLHSFQGAQPFKIVVKESCFCCVCIDTEPGHTGICENQRFTGVAYPVTLKPRKSLNGGEIPDVSGKEPIDSTQKVPPASSSIMDRENSEDR
ncbi:hypothetical protein HOLleu_36102 [Holothuria leucospilota]|uniref:Uncharacterized protein n=1 Tax=Holothuria leucospilota TaxID=206669 RepID=A0A9Q1BFH0_HOLLE|nr:hypothetical protein HOLleu_36102 [Holothuria leucospilota]